MNNWKNQLSAEIPTDLGKEIIFLKPRLSYVKEENSMKKYSQKHA